MPKTGFIFIIRDKSCFRELFWQHDTYFHWCMQTLDIAVSYIFNISWMSQISLCSVTTFPIAECRDQILTSNFACRIKIIIHWLLDGKSLSKLLRDELHIFCWFLWVSLIFFGQQWSDYVFGYPGIMSFLGYSTPQLGWRNLTYEKQSGRERICNCVVSILWKSWFMPHSFKNNIKRRVNIFL